jgi:hypothetical protein
MKTMIAALGASVLLFLCQTSSASNARGDFDPRVSAGFGLAQESLRLKGRDVSLVGLGSYIVNGARGCNDCHEQPDAARLSYRDFRDAIRSSSGADAPAAPAHASLGDREVRAVYEYWRAMSVR